MTGAATLPRRSRPAYPFRASRRARGRLAAALVPALLLLQLTCACILPGPAAAAATSSHDCCPGGDARHVPAPAHDRACGHCAVGPSLPEAPPAPLVSPLSHGVRLDASPPLAAPPIIPPATPRTSSEERGGGARARLRQHCVLVL